MCILASVYKRHSIIHFIYDFQVISTISSPRWRKISWNRSRKTLTWKSRMVSSVTIFCVKVFFRLFNVSYISFSVVWHVNLTARVFFNFCVVDTSDIVGKLKEKIMGDLKEEGLDLSNPEELKRQILEEMKVSYGVERKYQIQLHKTVSRSGLF